MAQVDYFLKIDGVDGESADDKHKGEIQVLSFSHGATNAGSAGIGTGQGTGKVQMQDFHFTAHTSKASPKLLLKCATGEHIKKVVLTCRKASKDPLEAYVYTLTDCFISSHQGGGSAHSEVLPVDQFSINFGQIEFSYTEQKADGSKGPTTKAGYNTTTNKSV